MSTHFNLADLFEAVADRVPSRGAVSCAERRLAFSDLEGRANSLAHGLRAGGVGPGDNVGIYLYNCVEALEAMLACFKIRAVPVNVNYRYVADELAYLLRDAQVTALFFHRSLGSEVATISPGPAELRLLVSVDDGTGETPEDRRAVPYEEVLAAGSPERDFKERSEDDLYIVYTGGTTGMPKGVVWRQEDIFFATLGGGNPGGPPIEKPEDIAETVVANRSQRVRPFLPRGHPGPSEFVSLALGPLVHASGQWSALGTLLGGGRCVLYPERSMDMGVVLDLVERERVTMLTLVGDASGRPLLDELRRDARAHDTSSLLLLGSGGSILSGEVKDGLLAELPSVLAISEAVGSSEAPVQAVAVGQRGRPLPSMRFSPRQGLTMVLDETMTPVRPGSGAVGRIATTGRIPLGYLGDSAKSAATFVEIDGRRWSLPGDMATVEADGSIRLLGRGSMCINTGGEKVYPEEVEAVLKAHPLVADAIVVGRPAPRWGEQVAAVVQPRDLARVPSVEELASHCRRHLAGYKVPRSLEVVEEVARSPSGKPDYRWAARLVGGQLQSSRPTGDQGPSGAGTG